MRDRLAAGLVERQRLDGGRERDTRAPETSVESGHLQGALLDDIRQVVRHV